MPKARAPKRYFVTRKEAKVERLPWGPHDWLSRPDIVDTEHLLMVRVNMPKGQAQEFHKQPSMEEVIYILEGKAEQWVGNNRRVLGPGDMAHIPQGAVHATFNIGRGVLRYLSVFGPASFRGPALIDVSGQEPWVTLRKKRQAVARKALEHGRRRRGASGDKRGGGRQAGKRSKPDRARATKKKETGKVVRKVGKAAKTRRRGRRK
jgi:quercetin dioxygenase-like cupin family protein